MMNRSGLIEVGCELVRSGSVRFLILHYLFPGTFLFGVVGNLLSFCIQIRNRSTVLLAFMTLSDLLFLLFRLPQSLATFRFFADSLHCRSVYYASKIPLVFIVNWLSTASIWFAVAVTAERTLAVCRPLKAMNLRSNPALIALVSTILLFGLLLNVNVLLVYSVNPPRCYQSGNVTLRIGGRPVTSEVFALYGSVSTGLNMLLIIVLPFILLIVLNTFLLLSLRGSRQELEHLGTRNSVEAKNQERRITIMVCAIICSFLILNFPSALVFFIGYFAFHRNHRLAVDISNYLIVVGKAINFLFYCMVCEKFRKSLREILLCQWWVSSRKSSAHSTTRNRDNRFSNESTELLATFSVHSNCRRLNS